MFARFAITGLLFGALVALGGAAMADGDGCPKGRHHGPPPEAFAACEGKADGDACSVTFRDDTAHAGTCQAPEGKQLACRPDDMPSRPDHE
ncbi:MAG TPA: hypothetical protein VGM56_07820 [Byssovorax sp.]|jgi:hypothetical protein